MDPFTSILLLVVGSLLLYHFLREPVARFEQLGVPHEKPAPILGNMAPVVFRRVSYQEHLERAYRRFSDCSYFGFYNFMTPTIVIREPELIASIAVKNFDRFCDHRGFVDEDLDPLMGKNLFALRGDHWREMRKLLSPAFTSMKMRFMFHLIRDCADSFADFVAAKSSRGRVYDLKEICGRYATDVIATCSFGFSLDSMRDPKNEFYVFARETINFMSSMSLKFMIGKNFPTLSRLLGIRIFSRKAHRYFLRIVGETVKMREEKGINRPDMIQLMMESRDKHDGGLTIEEMTNQAFVFLLGGYDTTSTFLSFVLHNIGVNPDVQAKLRAEIEEIARKTDGQPTYDSLKATPYMDAVLNETLRLYPLAFFLDRVCVKEFRLPPTRPGAEPVTLKPGDNVWFLPYALHRDTKYFADPIEFDPERFLRDEPAPFAYMPFGLGPRVCIGNRFALLEAKIMLFYLLWRCELEPCAKTQVPLKFCKKSFILMPENGFWLNIRTREEACLAKGNRGNEKIAGNGTVSTK